MPEFISKIDKNIILFAGPDIMSFLNLVVWEFVPFFLMYIKLINTIVT